MNLCLKKSVTLWHGLKQKEQISANLSTTIFQCVRCNLWHKMHFLLYNFFFSSDFFFFILWGFNVGGWSNLEKTIATGDHHISSAKSHFSYNIHACNCKIWDDVFGRLMYLVSIMRNATLLFLVSKLFLECVCNILYGVGIWDDTVV